MCCETHTRRKGGRETSKMKISTIIYDMDMNVKRYTQKHLPEESQFASISKKEVLKK